LHLSVSSGVGYRGANLLHACKEVNTGVQEFAQNNGPSLRPMDSST
jgi:hypothetical protein